MTRIRHAEPADLAAVERIHAAAAASDRLHRALGFAEVGTFTGVGVKFGRAWDVRWYQRKLGDPR